MPLKKLLTAERVAVHSEARTKESVLAELVKLAAPLSSSHDELLASVRAREAVFPTALDDGVALPHVRTPLVRELMLSACVLDEPIAFGASDGNPVDLLFLILSPSNAPSEHLSILRTVSELVSSADVLFSLRHAQTAAEFVAIIHRASRA